MKTILVCQGTGCTSSKSPKIMENFSENLDAIFDEVDI